MSKSAGQAAYRLHRFCRKGDVPKKYECTVEIIDDESKQVMAVCDVIGKAAFSPLAIMDHRQQVWQMRPNRKIMPSRWIVTDPGQNIVVQFDQKILGKMVNPLCRVLLSLEDGDGKEIYRLVDPRTNIPDRILGAGPDDWALMAGDVPVARLARLPRQSEPAKGIFGRLKNFLASSDSGLVSAGSDHVLPAPVALAMLLLFKELSDTSSG
jgi:hypothetical protein